MGLNPKTNIKNGLDFLSGEKILAKLSPAISRQLSFLKNEKKNKEFVFSLISCPIFRQSVHSASKQFQKFSSETAVWAQLNKCSVVDIGGTPRCIFRPYGSAEPILLDELQDNLLWNPIKNYLDLTQPYILALDETLIPYYGKDKEGNPFVVGGRTKKSTRTFFSYITISIVSGNMKFTLGILPMYKKESRLDSVKKLISTVESHGIRIKYLLMDRGYYNGNIFQYLMEKNIPFITPMRGGNAEAKEQIEQMKRSGQFPYHMKTNDGKGVDVDAVVVIKNVPKEHKLDRKKYGKHRAYVYVCYGISMSYNEIYNTYRHRFVIEATYRIANISMLKTSSRNPAVRYLCMIISFIIQNIWRLLRVKHFVRKQRGPKVIDEDEFRYNLFISLLHHALEKRLKSRFKISCSS